jgi:hypothetical protein
VVLAGVENGDKKRKELINSSLVFMSPVLTPNGVYSARIKSAGNEIRPSLEPMDPALTRRNLRKLREEQSQIDRSKSRLTLLASFAQPSCVTLFPVTTFFHRGRYLIVT